MIVICLLSLMIYTDQKRPRSLKCLSEHQCKRVGQLEGLVRPFQVEVNRTERYNLIYCHGIIGIIDTIF